MRTIIVSLFVAAIIIGAGNVETFGQTLPFRYKLNHLTGFSTPIFLTHAKDGTRRLFIMQQGGIIRVVQPGSTTATDFMNITTRVLSGGERGLLGLAFHPNFENNHYFFVYYTRQTDGQTMVSRFTAINNNSIGDPNSERVLLGPMAQPFSNHNGGMIEFREDSPGVHNLYIAKGDGGSGNDPDNRAQNINDILGKILRITPDVSGNDGNPPFTNPSDNPYVGVDGNDSIYAIGMRNPWRFSFDRGTNQLWVGDVGQGTWEEVDIINRGANYGWKVCEGAHLRGSTTDLCTNPSFTNPVFEYASNPSRCSVTGGYVYRGAQLALPYGTYIYGDYCTGEIFSWNGSQQNLLLDTDLNFGLVSFGEDEDGELYVVGHGGRIDKIMGNKTAFDYSGQGKADLSVYRQSGGSWWIRNSQNGSLTALEWGSGADRIAPADYDGDGKTDVAIFRPETGDWWVLNSLSSTLSVNNWGVGTDVIVPGDYGTDGRADYAVWRPSDGGWYVKGSDGTFSATSWGTATDKPVAADYDGDGKYDLTIFRTDGNWWSINSSNGATTVKQLGIATDKLVPADYTGDGKADVAIWRPADGGWWYLDSTTGAAVVRQWGIPTDIPAPADYDGNGKTDLAVFRPNEGNWWIFFDNGSSTAINWGTNGDQPTPNAYVR